ncbi:MAG: hypothetical protein EP330_19240 [Deltaproteobacteria bacterium]|nr:MAG: hypothetical protein EP330_19240 [Deltaproteobacteria bacterium]
MEIYVALVALIGIGGTFGWMAVAGLGVALVLRMPPEARAQVPGWLFVLHGAAVVTSVIWPIATLASLAAVVGGGVFALRAPADQRVAGLACAATGAAYLALELALVGVSLVYMQAAGAM